MKLFFIISFLLFAFNCKAEDHYEELSRRLKLVEERQEELLTEFSDNSPKVNSFLKDNLTIGGFYEPSYTLIQGENTQFQAASTSNILGLNISAEYGTKLKLVTQLLTGLTIPMQNPHNDPRGVSVNLPKRREFGSYFFGALLSQGYLDYGITDQIRIQGGQGYAPFGYAAQQRELVLFIRRGGPQILRTTELLSPLWAGFHLYQNLKLQKNRAGYNLYSFTRSENTRRPGVGGRLWMNSQSEKFQSGLSFQSASYYGHLEHTAGWDAHLQSSSYMLTMEYAHHFSRNNADSLTYYLEPSFFVYQEELILYTFFDYAKSMYNKTGTGIKAIADPYSKYEYGLGVNWLPTSYTRIRAGFTYYNYVHNHAVIEGQKRDYGSVDLSAGVAF